MSNSSLRTDSTETKASRRSILRTVTAAGVVGTGALAYGGVSNRASADCVEDLGSSKGANCDQDPWERGGRGFGDNCRDRNHNDTYKGSTTNFGVSWLGTKDTDNYYFASTSGAHSYFTYPSNARDACNGELDSSELYGGKFVDSCRFRVDMSHAEEDTQLVEHDNLTEAGGMTKQQWDDWYSEQKGQKASMCDIEDEFERMGFMDQDLPIWARGGIIGTAAFAGYVWNPVAAVAISTLGLAVEIAGNSYCDHPKESDDEYHLEYEWNCGDLATLAHASEFHVMMDSNQSQDVELDIVQEFTIDSVIENIPTTMEYKIIVPPNDCDPYVYSSRKY